MAACREPPTKKRTVELPLLISQSVWSVKKKSIRTSKAKAGWFSPWHDQTTTHTIYLWTASTKELHMEIWSLSFTNLNERLMGLSRDVLKRNKALCHRSCYSQITHKQHTNTDKMRYKKARSTKDSGMLSSYSKVDVRSPQTSASTSDVDSKEACLT